MRFKKSSELPGAGRTRAWHHHGSHTPTSPGTILVDKMAYHTKQIHWQCMWQMFGSFLSFLSGELIRVTLIKKSGISNEEMKKVKMRIFKR
jgi:hypothetical protein